MPRLAILPILLAAACSSPETAADVAIDDVVVDDTAEDPTDSETTAADTEELDADDDSAETTDAPDDADAATDSGSGWGTLATCDAARTFDPDAEPLLARDSDAFVPLDGVSRTALGQSLSAVLTGRVADAVTHASAGNYDVCFDEDRGIVVLAPASEGHARIAVSLAPQRALVFEAPHPLYDSLTIQQSWSLFEGTGAQAIVAAGNHRCANTDASGCDGRSSVCTGSSESYRSSDVAHVVDTSFQTAHEILSDTLAQTVFVSVHGMGGAGISLSDGTTEPLDEGDLVVELGQALATAIEDVTLCNPNPSLPVDERLCGTTNVQGRYTNGSANACDIAPPGGSGRFIHMEQTRAVREDPTEVIAAFLAVF